VWRGSKRKKEKNPLIQPLAAPYEESQKKIIIEDFVEVTTTVEPQLPVARVKQRKKIHLLDYE
jgi:hypothetical protein